MKEFYTVDIMDGNEIVSENVFDGTFEECVEYLNTHGYNEGEAQICKWKDDGDPEVIEIITEW